MKSKNRDIEQLIAKKAFEKAFHIMLQNFSKPMYALIFKITKNHADTDDILQNSWITILQKFR